MKNSPFESEERRPMSHANLFSVDRRLGEFLKFTYRSTLSSSIVSVVEKKF